MQRPMRILSLLALTLAGAISAIAAEPTSPADAARRYAEAEAVAKHCPGGRKTAKADTLAAGVSASDRVAFDAEVKKVTDVWAGAMGCVEADPTGRMNEQCRRIKRAFCANAWREIGPDGTVMPGLIDFKPE